MSVCGTGHRGNNGKLFSASCPVMRFGQRPRLDSRLSNHLSPCVHFRLKPAGRRNINLLCIDYALRPHLSSRLTLGGRTCPRKPWVYGGQNSHLAYRYSCLHSHFQELHLPFPSGFNAPGTLSYHAPGKPGASIASACCLSPIIFGATSLDESAITHCLNGGCL